MKTLIGIDGGGTKMLCWLTDTDGNFIRSCRFGPSNVHDLGVDGFNAEISQLPALLDTDAGDVAAVFAGLAGGTGYRAKVNAHLQKVFPNARCRNESDASNILWAGLGAGDGCGLISGTGSILYARSGGAMYRVGGWGWIFDNAGSGYDLGRDAILACLREYDGRDGHTLLSELLAEHFGVKSVRHNDRIWTEGKTYIAATAPVVFEAYRRGDRKAKEIMEKSADALAELVRRGGDFFDGNYRVSAAGSILTKEPEMFDLVKARVSDRVTLSVLDREPVAGAIEAAKWLLTLDELPVLSEE